MSRILVCILLFASALGAAQDRPLAPVECDDQFAECKEDCAIKWGGNTNLKFRAKLAPCLNKCGSTEQDCRETFFETRRNNLDEGAIAGSPSSRDVDSDGLPTKPAQKKPEQKRVEKKDDELRDDRRREEPVAEKNKEPEPKPAVELRPDEVPRSNRSKITKVDEKDEKAKEDKPQEAPKPAPVRDEPPPRREEPKKQVEEPAPAAKKTQKRDEPKKDERKKALDEWDPDAL